jgi:hypothetical protein
VNTNNGFRQWSGWIPVLPLIALAVVAYLVPLWHGLSTALPWGDQWFPQDFVPSESFIASRTNLFLNYAISGSLLVTGITLLLFNAIRRHTLSLSMAGIVAVGWPLIVFPLIGYFNMWSFFCLPLPVVLTGITIIRLCICRKPTDDLLVIPVNFLACFLIFSFANDWFNIFGD